MPQPTVKVEALLQAFERRNPRAPYIGMEASAAGGAGCGDFLKTLFGVEQVRLSLPNQHNVSPWGRALAQFIRAERRLRNIGLKLAARLPLGWPRLDDPAAFFNSEDLIDLHVSEALGFLRSRPFHLDQIDGLSAS